MLTGPVLLNWLPAIRCPSALTVLAGLVAEASPFTYLVHYQVYPLFGEHHLTGVAASVAVGIVLTQLLTLVRTRIRLRGSRPLTPEAATPVRR